MMSGTESGDSGSESGDGWKTSRALDAALVGLGAPACMHDHEFHGGLDGDPVYNLSHCTR